MSAIEDGVMQNDDLVRRIRANADTLESQSDELTRIRERSASLEATVKDMREALWTISGFERISGDSAYARGQNSMMAEMSSIAQSALASSESVVGKSEGEKDGVEQ
jgi:hypothetical protein